MGTESKGRAWFGKIYNKLETLLVEVDTFTSQSTLCLRSSDPSEWESVRGESEEGDPSSSSSCTCDLQQRNDRLALPSCESPSDPPSHQNFDIPGTVRVENLSASSLVVLDGEETLSGALTATTLGNDEEPIVTNEASNIDTTLLVPKELSAGEPPVSPGEESREEVRVDSWTDFVSMVSQSTQSSVESFGNVVTCSGDPGLATIETSMDDINLNPVATKITDLPVRDNVANIRCSIAGNLDDVIDGKSDVAPLDIKASYGIAFRENSSFVDDNALYAVHIRTKKLRSFKRRILDALASKRIREKEYEQLAIWFGDADMGSDLVEDSKQVEAKEDSKSSQVLESEDYAWELL